MPIFLAALLGGLINIAGTLAGRVLIGLGISVVTYSGLTSVMDFLRAGVVSSLVGLPPALLGMLGLMKVGSAISMVLSAIAVKQSLAGLVGGTFKRWVK